jgi:vacuolar-type H+-ATPase subunit C/Vma6
MTRAAASDLDFLAARLHARRSRMAEGESLDALCRIRNLPELSRSLHAGWETPNAAKLQRQLIQDLAGEIFRCLQHLDGSARRFVEWLLVRLQLENLRVLLRGYLNQMPLAGVQPHLIDLPGDLELDAPALMAAKTLGEFIAQLPANFLCKQLHTVAASEDHSPFLLEAALDAGYLQELLVRTARLPAEEREIVSPMIFHEVNFLQFMLAVRGRFHFGLTPETLLPLRVNGSGAGGSWFNALLSAPDIPATASSVVGVIIDALPANRSSAEAQTSQDVSTIEALAWKRYLRLANGAFRRSHLGVGAVAGYFGVRRVEIANLITLSEGIRLGADQRETRARMIPRAEREVAHV